MSDFNWPNETLDLQWSGNGPIPRIGDRVMTFLNGMGAGTVTGYFVEHGFLGVKVSLESPPDWFIAQSTTGSVAHFFGMDLQPAKRKEQV